MTPLLAPFIGKILLFFLILCVERVIGFPFISSYLFWNDVSPHNWIFEIILTFFFSLFVSSLFGLNILLVVLLYCGVKMVFSLSFFRKMSLLQMLVGGFLVSLVYWSSMTKTPRVMVFSVIQVGILVVLQLQQVSSLQLFRKRLVIKKL